MGRKLISFVIPVFNGQEYIDRCLRSIIVSEEMNFEIILINDGSTDNTKEICDAWAKKYDNIHVEHISPSGQGKARNIGMQLVKTDFVMFVDVDDEIIFDGVMNMLKISVENDYDIVCAPYYRLETTGKILVDNGLSEGLVNKYTTKEDKIRYDVIREKNVFGYLWTKVYKTQFIIENKLVLSEEKFAFMEDSLFNHEALVHDPKFYYTKTPSYVVDVTNTSTTRKSNIRIGPQAERFIGYFYTYLEERGKLEEHLDLIMPLTMRVAAFSLVKNIPYEGLSYKKIKEKVDIYADSKFFYSLTHIKKSYKHLFNITSKAEVLLYTICYFLLKYKLKTIMSLMFCVSYPIFKIYLNKNVK